VIGILAVIIIETIGYFLFKGVLKIEADRLFAARTIFHFMAVSAFFTIISVPYDAVIYARENMILIAIMGVFEAVLKLSVAFYVTWTNSDKLIIYGMLMAGISVLMMLIQRIYCHLKYQEVIISPKRYFNKVIFKEMTGFAGWVYLNSATSIIGNYGLGIVLNNFWGAALNAAQGIASQLNGQMMAFSNTMMKALNPGIVKAEGGGERERMLKMSLIGCKFSFLLFSFFAIPFLLETPYILKLWLKNVPDWTIIFCRLAILRTLLEQLTSALDTSISAQGDIKRISIVKSVLNIIPLPLIYFLFSNGSPPYVLYLVPILFWAIISGAVYIYFAMKNCNLNLSQYINYVFLKSMISFSVPMLLALIPITFMPDTFLRLTTVVSVTSISFISTLFFVGLNEEEKKFISGIFSSIIAKVRKVKPLII
jgi:O-antigen/teichoic acid export membrane protein